MATLAAVTGEGTSLGSILEQVAKEKGIDKKILIETIEAAILKAAQSVFGPTRELEARFNEDSCRSSADHLPERLLGLSAFPRPAAHTRRHEQRRSAGDRFHGRVGYGGVRFNRSSFRRTR